MLALTESLSKSPDGGIRVNQKACARDRWPASWWSLRADGKL